MLSFLAPLLLWACAAPPPAFIDRGGLDKAFALEDEVAVCAGLTMKDDDTRAYAAEKLMKWRHPQPCLCESLVRQGEWDAAVLKGVKTAKDDEHGGCAATLLDRPELQRRPELVIALSSVHVPAVEARLLAAARSEADVPTRSAAISLLRPEKNAEAMTIATAAIVDPDASIRAGAATALAGVESAAPLLTAATKDADAGVRGAALASLRSIQGFAFADVACPMLSTDADAGVRAAADAAMKATKDPALLACLRVHMGEKEESGEVRMAMLTSLRGSSAKEASDTLCDLIAPWTKMYVADAKVERESDVDIIEAQNFRDMNRSYECVERAIRAGGYNCWQKAYLHDYFKDMGGKVAVPKCGGGGGGGAASNEIVF